VEKEIPENKKIAFNGSGKTITVNCPEVKQKTKKKKNAKVKKADRKIEGIITFEDIVDADKFTATEDIEIWAPSS
jgi:hypothetical protein